MRGVGGLGGGGEEQKVEVRVCGSGMFGSRMSRVEVLWNVNEAFVQVSQGF